MNSLTLYHQALTIFGLLGASTCSATLLLIFLRGPLLAALERLHAAKRLTQLVVLLAFAFATLFGGAKHGSPTNDPPTLPPGFVGSGQDTNWFASVFSPSDCSLIAEKGYDAWLDEDYVGVNEQNGHFRADITVASLPDSGAPCYLVCGPYKVVVNQPGTYSFPLEVFKSYKVRTYPVALPFSISTDDGYRGSQLSNSPVLTASRPRLSLSAPSHDTPPEYEICEQPRLVIAPTEIPLDQAVGTHVSIWCNVASAVRRYSALISREFRLNFCNPSDAEIVAAEVEDLVEIIIDAPLGTCAGTITITDLHPCCGCGSCTDSDCTCGCDCWRHSQPNSTPTNSPSATP